MGCRFLVACFAPKNSGVGVERLPFFLAAFDPNFANTLVLPVGKKAYAVGAGFDRVKVVFHRKERQVFVHVLPHHVSWLNVECDLCDHTQRTKPNHGSPKRFSILSDERA